MRSISSVLAFVACAQMISLSSPAFAAEKSGSASADDKLRVHLSGSSSARLERRSTEGTEWTIACSAPCDKAVPADAEYRVTGDGVSASKSFHLAPSKDGTVTLSVAEQSKGTAGVGFAVLGVGAALVLGGSLLIGFGPGPSTVFSADNQTHPGHQNAMWIGSALILAGVGTAIAGTSFIVNNKEASVSGGAAEAASAQADLHESTPKPMAAVTSSPAFVLPVFSGTF